MTRVVSRRPHPGRDCHPISLQMDEDFEQASRMRHLARVNRCVLAGHSQAFVVSCRAFMCRQFHPTRERSVILSRAHHRICCRNPLHDILQDDQACAALHASRGKCRLCPPSG